ncbi:hypothetical protein HAX54_005233 [Datura stramonium]|uniref:Uncharacterized protein n=1 Tax=Datura stramonium TaxID=4076 RepID=A0ABS8T9M5_DATST|nr:hypothetical protein [Datura stramonium]
MECHVAELHSKFRDVINIIESLLQTYEESKSSAVVIQTSKKAVSFHGNSNFTPNINVDCKPTEGLNHLSEKTKTLPEVEFELAMEAKAVCVEHHASIIAELEYEVKCGLLLSDHT